MRSQICLGGTGVGVFHDHRRRVDLDRSAVLETSQHTVGPGYDFITGLQSISHLDVRGAGDASGNGNKDCLELSVFLAQDKNTLLRLGRNHRTAAGGYGRNVALGIDGRRCIKSERLDGDGKDVLFARRGDLGGRGESRPELVAGLIEGDDNFEVLGFFGAAGGLAGGDAGRAEQRLIANLSNMALEYLAGNRVDAYIGGLTEL